MMAVKIQMEPNWAEKKAHLTMKAIHLAWTMADQRGSSMARMMVLLIRMEPNY